MVSEDSVDTVEDNGTAHSCTTSSESLSFAEGGVGLRNQDYAQGKDYSEDCEEYWNGTEWSNQMALWQQVFWSSLFCSMLAIAITGNIMVSWIVLAHRRMRTVTNMFIVNLSLTDLMMSLFNCIFNFIYAMNDNHWPFGLLCCKLNNFVANVTVFTSVFSLVALTIDRYMAIVRPLNPRMSKTAARCILATVWLSSFLLSSPTWIYAATLTIEYHNGAVRTICYLEWPDGASIHSTQDFAYNIAFLVSGYLLPVCCMAVCYTRMSFALWGKSVGEINERQIEATRSKRKVVKMFIAMVTLFVVCWLPYHAYFIYHYYDREFSAMAYVHHIYLAVYWLAMANAMINPMLYYWMNARFRHYFKDVICSRMQHSRASIRILFSKVNREQRRSSPVPVRMGQEFFHQYHANNQDRVRLEMQNVNICKNHTPSQESSSHEGHQRCQLFVRGKSSSSSHENDKVVRDSTVPYRAAFGVTGDVRDPSPMAAGDAL